MQHSQLNLLINLASADGELSPEEEKLIHSVGQSQGLSEEQIKTMIANPQPIGDIKTISDDERFDFLYSVVQLMKVDGRVFRQEINFSKDVARKLGYKDKAVAEISAGIFSDPSITVDRESLKKKVNKYLK